MVSIQDLITSAQDKADQENTDFIQPETWVAMANRSIGNLYNILCSTNEDYNVDGYQFTIAGNTITTNFLDVSTIGNYHKVRSVERMLPNSQAGDPWMALRKCPSIHERHKHSRVVMDRYARPIVSYLDWGRKIEFLPALASAGTYNLLYIPSLPTFGLTDVIDGYWLTVNGWDEHIALDMAIKASIKEESFDLANALSMQKGQLEATIIKSMSARNASEPQYIVDVMNSGEGHWGGGNGGYGGY